MAASLARWLRALADWLDPLPPAPPAPPPPPEPYRKPGHVELLPESKVVLAARSLIAHAEAFAEGTSGEYKRHWVYAQLIKAFPKEAKRDLALWLERTVSEVKGPRRLP